MKLPSVLSAGAAGLALALSGALVAPVAAAPTAAQSDAADWLADQVPSGTHLFESRYGEGDGDVFVDHGLNLDLQFALREYGDAALGEQVYDAVVADAESYTDAFGTRYAGAVGKLAAYVELAGDDATDVDGRDLIADLKGLMVTEGPETGRFKDSPDGDFQSANAIGQSWGVRALGLVDDEDTDVAADHLADQQCADGGFRLNVGESCTSQVDATAFAITALDEVGGYDAEVADAIAYLQDEQAADGSFQGSDEPSSNSAGLAGAALRDAGDDDAADLASDWIASVQLGSGPDSGAIAPGQADFDTFDGDEVEPLARDRFVRATVQAILGLDAVKDVVEPGPVAEMTLEVSDATPDQGDTIEVTATGTDAEGNPVGDVTDEIELESSVETDTIEGNTVTFNDASPHVITATHLPTGTTAQITVQVTPATDAGGGAGSGGGTAAPGGGELADAGSTAAPWQLGAAAASVLLGAVLVMATRRRHA